MNREFAKLGEEQRKQLLQMQRCRKHVQGTGRSRGKLDQEGNRVDLGRGLKARGVVVLAELLARAGQRG